MKGKEGKDKQNQTSLHRFLLKRPASETAAKKTKTGDD